MRTSFFQKLLVGVLIIGLIQSSKMMKLQHHVEISIMCSLFRNEFDISTLGENLVGKAGNS